MSRYWKMGPSGLYSSPYPSAHADACQFVRQPNGVYACPKCWAFDFSRDDDPYAYMAPWTDSPGCRGCGKPIASHHLLCEVCFEREKWWWSDEPRSSSWRPGSTAPADGTEIIGAWTTLGQDGKTHVTMQDIVEFEDGAWHAEYSETYKPPTWWMPIPLSPEGGGE